jgi:tetratricopeptide (TPR) repeat protein
MSFAQRLTLASLMLFAVSAWAQQASQPDSSGANPQSSKQADVVPATGSGPRVAPENERPIARTSRRAPSPGAGRNCANAINLADCVAPPGSAGEEDASGAQQSSGDAQASSPAANASSDGANHEDSGGSLLQSLPPPRSEQGSSSSRDTKGKLGGVPPGGDVSEMHPFDPHKAAKDIEVGEFYLKRGNYKAAISRFRGALESKPNDALATFRLAEALEKDNQLAEASKYYSLYLDILPNGELAPMAREALERLERAQQASAPAR